MSPTRPQQGDKVLLLWDGGHAYWGTVHRVRDDLHGGVIEVTIEDPAFTVGQRVREITHYVFERREYILLADLRELIGARSRHHEPTASG